MTSPKDESIDFGSMRGASLAVLLGSGLGGVSDHWPVDDVLSFDKIPGSPAAAGVEGHAGELRRCTVSGIPCLFVCGRKHVYEGTPGDMAKLLEFVNGLGIRRLIVTSAAGSLVKSIYPGELVLVDDVLDFQFQTSSHAQSMVCGGRTRSADRREVPGSNGLADRTRLMDGTRFAGRPGMPDRTGLDPELRRQLWLAAARARVALGRGTIVTCAGPVYETPSEIGMFQQTGASLVTMSGAPEVRIANALGVRVAMVALVTNWASGISTVKLRHGDVLSAADRAIPDLTRVITQFIKNK